MTIGRLLERREDSAIVSCPRSATVREAVRLLAARRIGALPVMDGNAVAGIFSERDIVYCLGEGGPGEVCLDDAVEKVMTSPAITVDRRTSVLEALGLMTRRRIRHLPVVDGDRLIAFVSIGDLVKYRLEEIQSEAESLREYIQTA